MNDAKNLIVKKYVLNLYSYLEEDFIVSVLTKTQYDFRKFYDEISQKLKIDVSNRSATFEDRAVLVVERKVSDLKEEELKVIEKEINVLMEKKEQRKKSFERKLKIVVFKVQGKRILLCPICALEFFPSESVYCSQDHGLCKGCLRDVLMNSLAVAGGPQTTCGLDPDCTYEYLYNEVCSALTNEKDRRQYWNAVQQKNIVKSKIQYRACPACQWGCIYDPQEGDTTFYCRRSGCGKNWCLYCSRAGHGVGNLCPQEKEESEAQLTNCVAEAMSGAALMTCPHCNIMLRKTEGGCNHITCKNKECKKEFCCLCREKLNPPPEHRHWRPDHPQFDNATTLAADNDRIRIAGETAAAEWRQRHPNFKAEDIANRVQKFIDERVKKK